MGHRALNLRPPLPDRRGLQIRFAEPVEGLEALGILTIATA